MKVNRWATKLRARRNLTYECPLCKATKTLMQGENQSLSEFEASLPEDLPCGYRGCQQRALRTDRFDK